MRGDQTLHLHFYNTGYQRGAFCQTPKRFSSAGGHITNPQSNMQLSPNSSVPQIPQVMGQLKALVFIFLKYQRPQPELYYHVPR